MKSFNYKSYWVEAESSIGAIMGLEANKTCVVYVVE